LKTEISRTLGSIATLSLFITTMINASNEKSFGTIENKPDTMINKSYQTMSTVQLQEEVEKRSINGNLSFDMGMELMKRWTNG
jgi:hypothetical protein